MKPACIYYVYEAYLYQKKCTDFSLEQIDSHIKS